MKQVLFYASLFIAACGNDNTSIESQPNNAVAEKNDASSAGSVQTDGIVGEWEMVGSVMDTNDNLQIDDAERGNIKAAAFKDYMKLDGDGTGLFTIAKLEGRYEVVTNEKEKKSLTWYDKENGQHRIGTIVSVSKEELHVKEPGGNGLIIWRRL